MRETTTNWIPYDASLPNHRMPTEADTDDEGLVYYQRQDGYIGKAFWGHIWQSDLVVAWAPIPKSRPAEPYVPPETEPTKPMEWWLVLDKYGSTVDKYIDRETASDFADKIGGTYYLMREVLPGDPTPEDVKCLQLKYDHLKIAFDHALECVDRVFQESARNPNPILGDRCHFGEDKFDQVVRLAEDVAEAIRVMDREWNHGCGMLDRGDLWSCINKLRGTL